MIIKIAMAMIAIIAEKKRGKVYDEKLCTPFAYYLHSFFYDSMFVPLYCYKIPQQHEHSHV